MNKIISVGVERHIVAYEDNMDELRQVQQDIVLLANLIQFEGSEEGGEDLTDGGLPEPEALEVEEPISTPGADIGDESELSEGGENIDL